MSSPAPRDRAAPHAGEAHDRQQQRRLADAVAPEHGQAALLGNLERHAVEHDRVAIAGAHVARARAAAQPWMRPAEIDLAHARVGRDLLRRALDQNLAPHHDDDARGEAEHDVHVVLDEQHGDVLRQARRSPRTARRSHRGARRPPARRAAAPSAWWRAPARSRAAAAGRRPARGSADSSTAPSRSETRIA